MTQSPRPIQVTNTLSGKKETLVPIEPGKIRMYSCGPTVYGLIHIGNLRAALTSDLFFRYFKKAGYEVNYVRNYTDVDDKIIKRGWEEGIPADQVSKKYIQEVEKDYALAGVQDPTHKTTVTTHIEAILEMTQKLIDQGLAYVSPDGEVLYSIEKFSGYGKLSQKKIDDLIAGSRVEVNQKKRNPLDFTLWKPAKPDEPSWDSPWGKGRPGWHIECSAMASKWLGEQIDVHHGGIDLIFPHHENEIAQSEGACGKAPFVRYWLHNAFININSEKMSKSLGNFFLARDFMAQFSGEVARAMILSVHYRHPFDFNSEAVEQTLSLLTRIYEAKAKAQELLKVRTAGSDLVAESAWGEFAAAAEKVTTEIDENYANDFNTSGALAALFTLIRDFNRTAALPRASGTPGAVLGASAFLRVLHEEIGSVLGIGRQDPEKALADVSRIRRQLAERSGGSRPSEVEISAAIEARLLARKEKNFAKADEIRKEMETRGVRIKDSPTGTTWEYI